jgi:spermidine synthase
MDRSLALLLTLATGVAGLVYEVAWQKYLATLLGAQASATAAVLGIFLGGLSAGYALFGAVSRRVGRRPERRAVRLLRLYGGVELGIGVWAFLFPHLFGAADAFSTAVGGPGAAGFALDVALTALLIGPPTVLMGGTIPLLTQALARDLDESTRIHARIYAANTAGAFLGALAGGFLLVPWLGLDGVLRAMGLVNLAAGGLFVALRPAAAGGVVLEEPHRTGPLGARQAAFCAVALLAGFAMMTLQTILNRIGALALGSSHFTFAMVVAVFVLCLALGSFAVAALRRIPPVLVAGSQWALVALLGLLYLRLPDATYHAYVLRGLFGREPADFYAFHLAAFGAALLVLALPIGLSGALLPLLFHQLRRELGQLGSAAGRLYSWNTVGSLAGALLGGYLLLLWLDLHHVYRLALAALVGAAALLTRLVTPRLPAGPLGLAAAAALGGLFVLPPWDPVRLDAGLFRLRGDTPRALGADAYFERAAGIPVVFHDDDPVASVAVRHNPRRGERPDLSVFTNGKSDGSLLSDYPTMALAALLPALLCEAPRRSFVVGFGTGVSAGELAALEEGREVVVAEISPGVMRAARLFEPGNLAPTRSPRVRVVESDAYRALLRSREPFDVIVSEPSNPWVTGVEMLYSVEFLSAARDRMTPRGVYAQWLHLYETDAEVLSLVLRNYASVFPEVSVWFTEGPDVVLLGFRDASFALDPDRIAARFARADFRAGFARSGIQGLYALLAHELLPLGVVHAGSRKGPLHTLRHPILSDRAARAFFAGRYAELPKGESGATALAGARNSLLRRRAALPGGVLPEAVLEEATLETCRRHRERECATLAALWEREHPDSPQRVRALAELRARRGPRVLAPEQLSLLASFFASGDGSLPLPPSAQALYRLHYHHAAPFRPLGPAGSGAPEG